MFITVTLHYSEDSKLSLQTHKSKLNHAILFSRNKHSNIKLFIYSFPKEIFLYSFQYKFNKQDSHKITIQAQLKNVLYYIIFIIQTYS